MLELMLVVAIMGIALAIGIPAIYHMRNHETLNGVVADVLDVCSLARRRAIMSATTTAVVVHPQGGRFEVTTLGSAPDPGSAATPNAVPNFGDPPAHSSSDAGNGGMSATAQLSSHVSLEMLEVNFTNCKDWEEVFIRFYPNGTSDWCTIVLAGDGEWRKISLEEVTGLATAEPFVR